MSIGAGPDTGTGGPNPPRCRPRTPTCAPCQSQERHGLRAAWSKDTTQPASPAACHDLPDLSALFLGDREGGSDGGSGGGALSTGASRGGSGAASPLGHTSGQQSAFTPGPAGEGPGQQQQQGGDGGGSVGGADWRSRLLPSGASRGREAADAARRELLGGAGSGRAPAGPQPQAHPASAPRTPLSGAGEGAGATRVRTAAEIRAAYGRPTLASQNAAAAASLGGVMAETRSALAERGEKLRALHDKGSDLEESAATFAELAKQLAERERAKAGGKWFGLG
jgi:hypothetical protein